MTTAITPLKIYGRKNSSNVQKVLWVCDVLNVPYERIDAGGIEYRKVLFSLLTLLQDRFR